jgi:hypothetical protein
MIVDNRFRQAYPNLTQFIFERLAQVPSNGRVFRAFVKWSELSSTTARSILTQCTESPIIDFKEMPTSNGRFNGSVDADRIYLAKAICDKYKGSARDRADPRMHLLIESTLLHEMVHWGDWKDGVDQEPEEGKEFEREAYGRDISRYW